MGGPDVRGKRGLVVQSTNQGFGNTVGMEFCRKSRASVWHMDTVCTGGSIQRQQDLSKMLDFVALLQPAQSQSPSQSP